MQKQKPTTGTIITAAMVLLVFSLSRCTGDEATARQPGISVASFSLKEITNEHILANARIYVDNPMPFTISTRSLEYHITVNGSSLLREKHSEEITVKAYQGTLVTLPFRILSDSLEHVLAAKVNRTSDSAEFVFHVLMKLDAPVAGNIHFGYEESKTLPTFRPLVMIPGQLNIEASSSESYALTLSTEVANHNYFPMTMQDVHYEFTVDGNVLAGTIDGQTEILPQSKVEVPIRVEARNLPPGKTEWKALFERDDTPFNIRYRSRLVSDIEDVNGTPLEVNVSGFIKDIKKLHPIP